MRFTGIVWYATRDGSIFSFFFAVLFIYGLKRILFYFSQNLNLFFFWKKTTHVWTKLGGKKIVTDGTYVLILLLVIILIKDSYTKIYKGTNHRYLYPKKKELAVCQEEKEIIKGMNEYFLLKNKLLELDGKTDHFYRMFTPENSFYWLPGTMQEFKMHESAIYDSTISRRLQEFYDYTILRKERRVFKEFKDALPYSDFTRHVHEGIGISSSEIKYRYVFLYNTKDYKYIKNQNIRFMWDLMQVKYLIISASFSKALRKFRDWKNYRFISEYPNLGLNIFEIVKNKSYSKLAVLPLDDSENYNNIITKLNSGDIQLLRSMYSRLVFLDTDTSGFTLMESRSDSTTRYYDIESSQNAVLVEFESWNPNWELEVNNREELLDKAFQLFKAIKIKPGLNRIELIYNLKLFLLFFYLGIFVTMAYAVLFIWFHYKEKHGSHLDTFKLNPTLKR